MHRGVGKGFTLVELVVAIVVIGILVSIAGFGIVKYQADARDNQRATQSNTIAEALEKYYSKNGEYPSVRRIVNTYSENTAPTVATTLGINQDVLKMPRSTTEQSLAPINTTDPTSLHYVAESAINNDSCQNQLNGGCDRFTLTYQNESGDTVTITSRYDGTEKSTVASAPQKPVLSAGSGSVTNTVEVESTQPNCTANAERLTNMYTYRYRTNNGAWSSWVNWTTSPTFVVGASEGQTIDFLGQTRCDDGPTAGAPSPQSDIETYVMPVGAPSAPSIAIANAGNIVTATVSAASCPAGTAAQYGIRTRVNSGAWLPYSSWSTTRTSSQASTEGNRYDYQSQARCQGAATSPAVVTAVAGYTRPITSSSAPTISVSTNNTLSTWSWSTPSCPANTTAQYQYQSEANWNYISAWSGPFANYNTNTWNTAKQGFQYTRNIQARCVSSFATGPWSASATASYTRPIATPPAPTNFAVSISSDKKYVYTDFNVSACGPGTTYEYQYMANWTGTTTFTGTWAATGYIGYAPRATQVVTDASGNYVPFSAGSKTRIQARYRCVNQTTGLVGAWGPVAIGPIFTVP